MNGRFISQTRKQAWCFLKLYFPVIWSFERLIQAIKNTFKTNNMTNWSWNTKRIYNLSQILKADPLIIMLGKKKILIIRIIIPKKKTLSDSGYINIFRVSYDLVFEYIDTHKLYTLKKDILKETSYSYFHLH